MISGYQSGYSSGSSGNRYNSSSGGDSRPREFQGSHHQTRQGHQGHQGYQSRPAQQGHQSQQRYQNHQSQSQGPGPWANKYNSPNHQQNRPSYSTQPYQHQQNRGSNRGTSQPWVNFKRLSNPANSKSKFFTV